MHLAWLLCVASLVALIASGSPVNSDPGSLRQTLKSLDSCIVKSTYSFIQPEYSFPTDEASFKKSCEIQADAFKCLRESSKSLEALLKRGLTTLYSTRQRFNKKYCPNLKSEATKKLISDLSCLQRKKLQHLTETNAEFVNLGLEIERRRGSNTTNELKYICCGLANYRKNMIGAASGECAASRENLENVMKSIVVSDASILCGDEEDNLKNVCPTLKPIRVSKQVTAETRATSEAAIILYLILTLGEAPASK